MALLTSFTDDNKVTDTALLVKYQVEQDSFRRVGWHKEPGKSYETYGEYDQPFYRCTRYATKSYSYVGMNYSTALSCQQSKLNQYTRDYSRVKVIETTDPLGRPTAIISSDTSRFCGSDIACQHFDGGMWNVVINVNETDEKALSVFPTNLPALFAEENERKYDETRHW